jgi:hypothetical protein
LDPSTLYSTYFIFEIDECAMSYTMPYDISAGKFLYINSRLDADTQEELVNFLKDQSIAFSWEYTDMWGIHLDTCIHLIYTQALMTPIRKPH